MSLTNEQIMEAISQKSVIEIVELVKAMEEKFGVSAAPVAVAAPAAAAAGEAAAQEEKDSFDLVLSNVGDKKVNVIKAVREITGLGLKEAKDVVDGAPKTVKESMTKADGEEGLKKLTDAGAQAELK